MWLLFASAAALFFGIRGIFYHWASQKRLERNLLLMGVFSSGFAGSLILALAGGDDWTLPALIGILMGLFSYIANACLFKGFAVGNPSVIALLSGLPAVVVVTLAYLLWNETLTPIQWTAFALILGGLLTVRYSKDIRQGGLRGLGWGLLVLFFFGFNDVASKWSTRMEADLLPTLAFMYGTGAACFGIGWLRGRKRAAPEPSGSDAVWTAGRIYSSGMLIGMTNLGGMFLLMNAFRTGVTGLVSAVAAMNIVIILLYTHFSVHRLRPTEWLGVAVTMAGIGVLQAG